MTVRYANLLVLLYAHPTYLFHNGRKGGRIQAAQSTQLVLQYQLGQFLLIRGTVRRNTNTMGNLSGCAE